VPFVIFGLFTTKLISADLAIACNTFTHPTKQTNKYKQSNGQSDPKFVTFIATGGCKPLTGGDDQTTAPITPTGDPMTTATTAASECPAGQIKVVTSQADVCVEEFTCKKKVSCSFDHDCGHSCDGLPSSVHSFSVVVALIEAGESRPTSQK
jgi:hypothetical protein